MSTATQTQLERQTPGAPRWSLGTRVAFRFWCLYFGLYCVTTQVFGGLFPIPGIEIPDVSNLPPIRPLVFWVAAHVFGVRQPLVNTGSGSGDKTFDWVLSFCLLVIAMLGCGIWSLLARHRESHIALSKWFRLFLRLAVAGQMFGYGVAKVVPLQMPFPSLARLIEPYGNFSPMGVLWASIGASPGYEIFTGCAEMLGGLLLITPRTSMLGALVCLVDAVEIFALNMTYDVPVKLFSFHLLMMSLFLLAPEFSRLVRFLLLNRAAEASAQPELFRSRRANRIALAAQVLFGLCMVGTSVYGSWGAWHTYGGGQVKSPLYGIWNVNQLSIDGEERSPLLTDYGRWRRVIFDAPERISLQRMDDTVAAYTAVIQTEAKTIAVTKPADKNWKAGLTFERPAPDRLVLDGNMDGHRIHMKLSLMDRSKFLLVNRGFHWIQEYPFNK